jgi:WD repeat-containing protein 23
MRTVPAQIMQLLGHAGLRRIFANQREGGAGITLDMDEEDDNDDADIYSSMGTRRRPAKRRMKHEFPAVPNEVGRKLMDGGVFGSSEFYRDNPRKRKTRLARKLMSRELGTDRNHSTRGTSAISQVWTMSCLGSALALVMANKS